MFVLELTTCAICLAGFAFLFGNALRMPYPQSFWDGPGAFPAVLSTVLFLICVFWLVDLLRARKKARGQTVATAEVPPEGDKAALEKKKKERKSFLVISVLTVFYVMVLMPLIPFPLATFVYLTTCFLLFSKTKWWISLIISGSTSAAIFLIFTFVLHLPMPR